MDAVGLLVAAVAGYLLGTFPSADLAARGARRGGPPVDLRAAGSGNPGATNAAQVLGRRWGLVVLALDLLKGVAAGFLGMAIAGDGGGYAAATAAVAGHTFPVWTHFRGGKGVATVAGATLAVFPVYFPIELAVVAIGALALRNAERAVQVSTVIGIVAATLWWAADLPNGWGPPPGPGLVAFAAVSSALILTRFAQARRARVEALRG